MFILPIILRGGQKNRWKDANIFKACFAVLFGLDMWYHRLMNNKFKKGLILGGLLTAIVVGLTRTERGKKIAEEFQEESKMLAGRIKKRLADFEDITKENFEDLVDLIVNEYAEKKELAADAKDSIVKALKEKWLEMEEEYLSDKDKEEIE
ncbi:MAG: hypothetical protein WC397_04275 [Candidatus Paceibacterota bacterium]|jgi:gas vesicle protein